MLAALAAVFVWSAIAPLDRLTWWLEVFPAIAGAAFLFATCRRFPFTRLAYCLIFLHMVILLVGGHYTYAEVPWFNALRDATGGSRNNFDKVGHFAQGFVPAIVAREILVRRGVIRGRRWLFFIVVCICMAISSGYELFEWAAAAVKGGAADAFLGSQGDLWDTQKDMFTALIGAIVAQLALATVHDKQMERISERMNP